jgi:hypothetical protein
MEAVKPGAYLAIMSLLPRESGKQLCPLINQKSPTFAFGGPNFFHFFSPLRLGPLADTHCLKI